MSGDDLYRQVVRMLVDCEYVGSIDVQRKCSVGYGAAMRIIDRLVIQGLVRRVHDVGVPRPWKVVRAEVEEAVKTWAARRDTEVRE